MHRCQKFVSISLKLSLLLSSLLFWNTSYTQLTISGRVTDSLQNPVAGCTVQLMRAPDTAFVKGSITNDKGNYQFLQMAADVYFLKYTFSGMKTVYKPLDLSSYTNPMFEAPDFQLAIASKSMSEVKVVAKKDLYEQKIDRLVINVAAQSINSGGTAFEVLQRAPGVIVDNQTNELSLMGKEGVLIYLDNKPTYMTQADVVAMLKGMPSDNIDRIEIITNPSSKFDAAGNSGIINILRKKNNSFGTNGQLTGAIGTGKYEKERIGLQLTHRQQKLTVYGGYNLVAGGDFLDFTKDGIQTDPSASQPQRINISAIATNQTIKNTTHSIKLGADAELSSKSAISFIYNLLLDKSREEGPAYTNFSRSEQAPVYFSAITDKMLNNQSSNHLLNLNFSHSFKKNQAQFSADADYGYFNRDFDNRLTTTATLSTEFPVPAATGFINTMPTTIIIKSIKADISWQPVKNIKYETGIKTTFVTNGNYLKIYEGAPGSETYNAAKDNEFNYDEKVYAAYFNISGKLNKKIEYQTGLRYEQTHSLAHSVTLNDKQVQQYGKFFPSLFIKYNAKENQSYAFSYSYRIDRPNYQDMNPGPKFIDQYSYSIGNPFLQPQYTHGIDLRYNYGKSFYTSIGANFIEQHMQAVNHYTEGNKFYRIKENVGKAQMFTLAAGYTENILKNWQTQITAFAYYNFLQFPFENTFYKFENLAARINLNNNWRFGKGWSADLAGWYNTPKRRLMGVHKWEASVDAGLQKIVSSKLRLKLTAQDLLRTARTRSLTDLPSFYQYAKIRRDTRMVLLSINYNFGNDKLKAAKTRKTGLEEEAKRASQ